MKNITIASTEYPQEFYTVISEPICHYHYDAGHETYNYWCVMVMDVNRKITYLPLDYIKDSFIVLNNDSIR